MSAALPSVPMYGSDGDEQRHVGGRLRETRAGLQRDGVLVDVAAAELSGSNDDEFAAEACALLTQPSGCPAAGGAGGSVTIGQVMLSSTS